jgi:hypothetical protein
LQINPGVRWADELLQMPLPWRLVLDPYDVLGIARDATLEEARAAYRRLAQLFHPDRLHDLRPAVQAEGARRMREANEAIREINARSGRPLRAPGHEPRPHGRPDRASTKVTDRRIYDVELESVGGPVLHARWGGEHAAATLAALREAHRTHARAVRQVEWGTYEMILTGSEMRHFLRTRVQCGGIATVVAADPQLQERLDIGGPLTSIGLESVIEVLDSQARYSLVADLY